MHRAWDIVELVENICAHLAPADLVRLKTDTAKDLALLSRTSTIFLDPALDVLWRSQDSLIHLLRCMPDDLLEIPVVPPDPERRYSHGRSPPAPPIRLRRPILPTDWERPLFYMRRVKFFSMGRPTRYSDVLDAFGPCLPTPYIFPNLEKLWWNEPPFTHLSFFLTLRLTNIHLSSVNTELSVISNYVLQCPGLKTVHLSLKAGGVYNPAARSIWPFSSIVRGLMHIEDLHVPEVNSTAMEHLAQLPRLKSLGFSYQGALEEPQPFEQSVRFPALFRLSVPLVATAAWDFYSTLAAHCSHTSLLQILNGGQTQLPGEPTPEQIVANSVGGDILQPLFSFPNLHKVQLRHPVGFDLDDATILVMARSWPRITSLSLVASTTSHMPSRVTLEGLYAFAQHCPRLYELTITFDATLAPRTLPSDETRTNQLCLKCLNLGYSPVGDPGPVAEFLFSIFPHLWAIRSEDKNTAVGAWLPVRTMFKELQSRLPNKLLLLYRRVQHSPAARARIHDAPNSALTHHPRQRRARLKYPCSSPAVHVVTRPQLAVCRPLPAHASLCSDSEESDPPLRVAPTLADGMRSRKRRAPGAVHSPPNETAGAAEAARGRPTTRSTAVSLEPAKKLRLIATGKTGKGRWETVESE
ncbi:hypothetical protein GGX14DRAFT_593050 [Mycena pura]|uniref:F-box domain-containing protein n=1 Tax=Mycena pura TaxID=153505 RepID=A0AAD6XYY4_9AGAR|nr:hypothetical protein GGX14DRAFT_593050 [Mycena pura]